MPLEGIYGALINEMSDIDETQPSTWCTPSIYTLIMLFADT